MAVANDSVLVTPGSGATLATHLLGGKEHQAMVLTDADGHILGSAPTYILHQTPRVTTAAATDFFDLFNASASAKVIRLKSLYAVLQVTAAHAFTVTWQFSLIRTSAIGTGGTNHTFEGAAAPAAGAINIARPDTVGAATPLPTGITCRSLPTGGATGAAFYFSIGLGSEETLMSATHQIQHINWLDLHKGITYKLQEGQGIKIRQITATASTGINFGWTLTFEVIP